MIKFEFAYRPSAKPCRAARSDSMKSNTTAIAFASSAMPSVRLVTKGGHDWTNSG
jgi:hypothetical protein